jgi:UDP-3-O-[3-hydroxymyristoyl] glucosamine N-acyltransferase
MADARFYVNRGPFSAGAIAEVTGAELVHGSRSLTLTDVAPLDTAAPDHVSFFDNTKYREQFQKSRAGACFVRRKFAAEAPRSMALFITEDPYRAYALAAQKFYPVTAERVATEIAPSAVIDASVTLGEGVVIAPGVVIGGGVKIGAGTRIGANSVIAQGVEIGEDCQIAALVGLSHALIGNRVILHRGVQIGQDGFGFALGREAHVKVPQLGRVVIGDDVEIGANTTIDRGTGPDTVIGAGSKIDNLVQIGHNAQVGRKVVLVALCGISGSVRIGDGAVIGGQVGMVGHITVGAGARVAAQSGVGADIPPGKSYGGTPSVPIRDWHRQTFTIAKIAKTDRGSHDGDE